MTIKTQATDKKKVARGEKERDQAR